jgi:hypothetical protein
MRAKRPYIIRLKIDAFSYYIRAIYSSSSINIKLKRLVAKKRPLFPTLVNLREFLRNCSLSAAPSI